MFLELRTNNKTVGIKQVRKALNSYKVEKVFIALDAEKKIIDEITELCTEKQVEIIHVKNMKKLGDACRIDVNAATAALLK